MMMRRMLVMIMMIWMMIYDDHDVFLHGTTWESQSSLFCSPKGQINFVSTGLYEEQG